jgi:hypothetical protein
MGDLFYSDICSLIIGNEPPIGQSSHKLYRLNANQKHQVLGPKRSHSEAEAGPSTKSTGRLASRGYV